MRCYFFLKMHQFDQFFRRFFGGLGRQVGHRPVLSLVAPVVATIALALMLDQFVHKRDPEFLFSPVNGKARLIFGHFYSFDFAPTKF